MRWRSSRILEFPPHRLRLADTDPKAAKRAERQVAVLFGSSVVGTVIFLVAYFAIDLGPDSTIATIRLQNALLGIGTAFAMLGIGTGIVHWAKALMPDHEVSEERHASPHRGRPPGGSPDR